MYPSREAAARSVNRVQFKAQRGVGGVLRMMMYSGPDHQGHDFGYIPFCVCVSVCVKVHCLLDHSHAHTYRHKTIINSYIQRMN